MSEYSHIFVDFDRTLSDTDLFITWIDHQLTLRVPEYKGGFASTARDFYLPGPDTTRLYDFAGHMLALTGQSWDDVAHELKSAADTEATDFCFPDAHQYLARLALSGSQVQLLTFGAESFQMFKIGLCTELKAHPLPVHVVSGHKSEYIKQHFPDVIRGVLVDDKRHADLPETVEQVWLNRKAGAPRQVMADGLVIVNSLDQAPK